MLSLGEKLLQYEKQGFLSFHTPGHKGKREFFTGIHFPEQDLTELPGLDMLHAPEGVIAEAQKRAAEVFGADKSFLLVNGATVGNQAMFLSLGAMGTPEGIGESDGLLSSGKNVLVERRSHRSVMSALVISGFRPQYIPSIVHPEFHLPLGLSLEGLKHRLHEVQAIHITYPGYYGNLSDLKAIIRERNQNVPEVPVFVDQAHGSHYLSSLFPESALECGADLVLHSTHKTLSALTQAAMLHLKGSRIPASVLGQALELLQSSSPNYLLMASLERAVETALETWRWQLLYEAVQELQDRVGSILRILNAKDQGCYGIAGVDWSKILVNTNSLGIPASVCVEHLRKNYGIEPELWDDENILFLLGIGNTPEEVQILTKGLMSLSGLARETGVRTQSRYPLCEEYEVPFPPVRYSPREAYFAQKKKIPLKESLGAIAGESISPYPPGIPLIVMGEEITPEVLNLLMSPKVKRWQGWEEPGKAIWVIEEG